MQGSIPSLFLLLALIVLGLSYTGCTCDRPPSFSHYIPDSVDHFLPYSNASTFQMVGDSGSVCTYLVTDLGTRMEEVDNCIECCSEQYGELRQVQLTGNPGGMVLKAVILAEGHDGVGTGNFFEVSVTNKGFTQGFYIGQDECVGQIACVQSMVVQGQQYPLLYRLENYLNDTIGDHVDRVYYSPVVGFVRLELNNGASWELVP